VVEILLPFFNTTQMTKTKKIELAKPEITWKAKGKGGEVREIPMSQMSDSHLQKSLWSVQKRYTELSKRTDNLLRLEALIEDEAASRDLKMIDYDEEAEKARIKSQKEKHT
jgi:hypothetical protein